VSPPSGAPEHRERLGAVAAGTCYVLWGLVPLYWKPLASVNAVELIAHRHVWSLAFLLMLLLGLEGGLVEVGQAFRSWRSVGRCLLGACLLTTNWLAYVWGVNSGHVIDTSLGYFLVPLCSVVAGRFLLHEHLRRVQWLAVGIAATGVLLLVLRARTFPWIALVLAGSWSAYSVMRKRATIGSIPGLAMETLLLSPLAVGFLLWRHHEGTGALGRVDLRTHLLILSAGIVTAVPLMLFAYAARRIRLSTLGVLQYLAPTGQLILGIWVYGEPFSRGRLMSFALIWAALVLYTADNLRQAARPR
jgi:chloramphenicol-sensitive protein RarD